MVAIATARQTSGVGKLAASVRACANRQSPNKHGNLIAPVRRQREPAAADFRLVHHVVMDQRRQMHHLDDDGHGDMGIVDLAQGIGRQRHQRRAQVLALPVQRVIGVTANGRIKSLDLLGQPTGDRLQKRLHRMNNLFPGISRFGT